MNPGQGEEDPIGSIFRVLAHPMRRNVLRSIQTTEETTVEMLAQDLADIDKSQADGGEPHEEIIEIKVALHHHHLPKMVDARVISYDPDMETITTNDATDVAYDLMDSVSN